MMPFMLCDLAQLISIALRKKCLLKLDGLEEGSERHSDCTLNSERPKQERIHEGKNEFFNRLCRGSICVCERFARVCCTGDLAATAGLSTDSTESAKSAREQF